MSPRSASIAIALGVALLGLPMLATSCGKAPPTPRAKLAPPPVSAMDGQVMTANETPIEETLEQQLSVTLRPDVGDPVDVNLAPGWYLEENGLRFEEGDRIQVEGTVRTSQGVLVASKVRKGNTTVLLRNASGEPLWEEPRAEEPRQMPDGGPDDDAGVAR